MLAFGIEAGDDTSVPKMQQVLPSQPKCTYSRKIYGFSRRVPIGCGRFPASCPPSATMSLERSALFKVKARKTYKDTGQL
jgi:hypothetical protein